MRDKLDETAKLLGFAAFGIFHAENGHLRLKVTQLLEQLATVRARVALQQVAAVVEEEERKRMV